MKAIDTCALVDSSTYISYINWQFVHKNKLPTKKLYKSLPTLLTDLTLVKRYRGGCIADHHTHLDV